jgi:glycosyltransferase involved in cell wall biosynthesis
MRILSITAGAAGTYCGSCFRDNALAAELLSQGHKVALVPVYTPTHTDEPNQSESRVLFGGISVYLQHRAAIFRKLPRFLDSIFDSPRLIEAFASRAAATDPAVLGGLTVSMLQGLDGVLNREFEKLVESLAGDPVPDVINLPNSLLIALAKPLREAFHRSVCCTLQGEELFVNGLKPPFRQKALDLMRQQVRDVDRFIAVSDYCARFMSDLLAIPSDKMRVVPLGIGMHGYDRAPDKDANTFRVGYFARIAPEKGLHLLADAYVRFRKKTPGAQCSLDVAGAMPPNQKRYLDDARQTLERAGLAGEFTYRGTLDRAGKIAFLQKLDLLSVPATYDEPKGMFVLEAMACGVPVVQPRRGAFIEVVENTGGGLLVEPDDSESLAAGLHGLWQDRELLAALSDRAYKVVRSRYTVAQSARRLLEVYNEVLSSPNQGSSQLAPSFQRQ